MHDLKYGLATIYYMYIFILISLYYSQYLQWYKNLDYLCPVKTFQHDSTTEGSIAIYHLSALPDVQTQGYPYLGGWPVHPLQKIRWAAKPSFVSVRFCELITKILPIFILVLPFAIKIILTIRLSSFRNAHEMEY